jgi:hypothetical protein
MTIDPGNTKQMKMYFFLNTTVCNQGKTYAAPFVPDKVWRKKWFIGMQVGGGRGDGGRHMVLVVFPDIYIQYIHTAHLHKYACVASNTHFRETEQEERLIDVFADNF